MLCFFGVGFCNREEKRSNFSEWPLSQATRSACRLMVAVMIRMAQIG